MKKIAIVSLAASIFITTLPFPQSASAQYTYPTGAMSLLTPAIENRINNAVSEEGGFSRLSIGVVYGGNLVYVHGYGASAGMVSNIASVSKSVLTAVTMALVDEGAISLDSDVSSIGYTFLLNGERRAVTLRHLLSNRSGIRYCDDRDHYARPPMTFDLRSEPGTSYSYCNHGFNVALWYVASQVCSRYGTCNDYRYDRTTYARLMDEYINNKLCTDLHVYPGVSWLGSGGVETTAAHLALYASGLINSSIVSRYYSRNLMWTRYASDSDYGMGWFVITPGQQVYVPGYVSTATAHIRLLDYNGSSKIAVAAIHRPGGSANYQKISRLSRRIASILSNSGNPCQNPSDCTTLQDPCGGTLPTSTPQPTPTSPPGTTTTPYPTITPGPSPTPEPTATPTSPPTPTSSPAPFFVPSQSGVECLFGYDNIASLQGLECIFANIVAAILSIAGIVLFIMLLVGGLAYLTSTGDPKALEAAQKILTYAIIGLVVVAVSYLTLVLINLTTGADVTTFRINLP